MRSPDPPSAVGKWRESGAGQLAFRGTHVFVADVLEQVAGGLAWEAIIKEWNGNFSKEAIAEAVQLATQALLEHVGDFILMPAAA